jgi:hypothetical protein
MMRYCFRRKCYLMRKTHLPQRLTASSSLQGRKPEQEGDGTFFEGSSFASCQGSGDGWPHSNSIESSCIQKR